MLPTPPIQSDGGASRRWQAFHPIANRADSKHFTEMTAPSRNTGVRAIPWAGAAFRERLDNRLREPADWCFPPSREPLRGRARLCATSYPWRRFAADSPSALYSQLRPGRSALERLGQGGVGGNR